MLSEFLDTRMTVQNRTTTADAFGGVSTAFTDGVSFMCGIVRDNASEAVKGEQNATTAVYTIVYKTHIALKSGDRLKDASGNLFEVVDGSVSCPAVASADMAHSEAKVRRVVMP